MDCALYYFRLIREISIDPVKESLHEWAFQELIFESNFYKGKSKQEYEAYVNEVARFIDLHLEMNIPEDIKIRMFFLWMDFDMEGVIRPKQNDETRPLRTNFLIDLYKLKGSDLTQTQVYEASKQYNFNAKKLWEHYQKHYNNIKEKANQ